MGLIINQVDQKKKWTAPMTEVLAQRLRQYLGHGGGAIGESLNWDINRIEHRDEEVG
ncbi:MAG: hypothetical protein ACKVH8_17780 [Pirellulales bacterium]